MVWLIHVNGTKYPECFIWKLSGKVHCALCIWNYFLWNCLGMELSSLSLINLVQKFIARSSWDNAAALIRESSCCHSSVWKPGFYSREDSLQPFHYLAAHKWAPLQTEVKRTARDSSLGVFIHCRWDHYAEKLNMNGGGLGSLLKESGISGRSMDKSHERDSKGKVLLLRGK